MDQFVEFLADPVSVLGVGQSGLDGLEQQLPGERAWAAVGAADLDGLEGLADGVVAEPLAGAGITFEGLFNSLLADGLPSGEGKFVGEADEVIGAGACGLGAPRARDTTSDEVTTARLGSCRDHGFSSGFGNLRNAHIDT
jgi:hypothetical protein